MEAYETVGKEVRDAIARIGGTPPENIPLPNISKKWSSALKNLALV